MNSIRRSSKSNNAYPSDVEAHPTIILSAGIVSHVFTDHGLIYTCLYFRDIYYAYHVSKEASSFISFSS